MVYDVICSSRGKLEKGVSILLSKFFAQMIKNVLLELSSSKPDFIRELIKVLWVCSNYG